MPKPLGDQVTNASLDTVQTITAPAAAVGVYMQAHTQNVRVTLDNGTTAPTDSVGFALRTTDPVAYFEVNGGHVIKAIEEAASATLTYQWVML